MAVPAATYKSSNTNYGPIWLDGTNCTGTESSIGLCGHNPWGTNDCDHTEDIGVACQTSEWDEKDDTEECTMHIRIIYIAGFIPRIKEVSRFYL